jgi:hypothetical protein
MLWMPESHDDKALHFPSDFDCQKRSLKTKKKNPFVQLIEMFAPVQP